MTYTLPEQGLYAPKTSKKEQDGECLGKVSFSYTLEGALRAGLVHYSAIPVQKALSGTVSCSNRAYARDTSRGLRVLCTSPAYARDRLVRDRRLQNSGFYTRQACAQVRLMHATLRYTMFPNRSVEELGTLRRET